MAEGSFVGGKYRLARLIGEGAMGAVWSAVNERTEREVAIKLVSCSAVSTDLRHRLLREARACGRIRHPNVVELYDVGETEQGDPFLVMERLAGETLEQRIDREGRLPVDDAARIALEIALALRAAHDARIVHRDLKPANVFLHQAPDAFQPVVKVVDFGVSKILSPTEASSTVTGSAVGTPAYMSPEQARGERDVDHRADLWALGVVLFELLTGTRPFLGETPYTVVAAILSGPIPRVSEVVGHVSPLLDDLVHGCLQRSVAERIASADEIVAALRAFRGEADSLASGRRSAANVGASPAAVAGGAPPPGPAAPPGAPSAPPPPRGGGPGAMGGPTPPAGAGRAPGAAPETSTVPLSKSALAGSSSPRPWRAAVLGSVAIIVLGVSLTLALRRAPAQAVLSGDPRPAPEVTRPPVVDASMEDATPASSDEASAATVAAASATASAAPRGEKREGQHRAGGPRPPPSAAPATPVPPQSERPKASPPAVTAPRIPDDPG